MALLLQRSACNACEYEEDAGSLLREKRGLKEVAN